MSARGGRNNTGPWSRLRPVNLDPLEEMGLPSKGDNRLLDFKRQERYYTQIVDRYMTFCSSAGDDLLHRLSTLSLSSSSNQPSQPTLPRPSTQLRASATVTLPSTPSTALPVNHSPSSNNNNNAGTDGQKDISILLMAMRKLREAIVAAHRIDDFSKQVYIFCIRTTILAKHMESYHPALLHLLYTMHPTSPLTKTELHEFASYLILDLACRQADLAGAQRVRVRFRVGAGGSTLGDTNGLGSGKVGKVLFALVHDDYELWRRVRRSVDAHQGALMDWAEEGVRMHALKCLGRAYLNVDLAFLERVTDEKWATLVGTHKVGWELQDAKVIIRKPKAR